MSLMTVQGLKKRYLGGVNALDGVDMNIDPGRIIGLLGPNGSGKTTLFKCLAGLLQPDGGEIIYPGGAKRGVESKKTVSLLPDVLRLPSWMRVRDAMEYWRDIFPDYLHGRCRDMMSMLDLEPDMKIRSLSKGMQERVALMLTFSRETSVYLLDEPLGGIDPVGKSKLLESILAVDLSNSAILISTHLVKDVETVFDSFYLLNRGKIVYYGDCENIREESGKTAEQVYLEVFSR
ncbi:MAG: ABC transporter ATP-binding protein [Oscillospiraceae bacterium]|jgi:ABC-2 type transport system ATP-binding protein|nr:ABC transporter ATP-binding protein [Oscillospiraceae bacterium]